MGGSEAVDTLIQERLSNTPAGMVDTEPSVQDFTTTGDTHDSTMSATNTSRLNLSGHVLVSPHREGNVTYPRTGDLEYIR